MAKTTKRRLRKERNTKRTTNKHLVKRSIKRIIKGGEETKESEKTETVKSAENVEKGESTSSPYILVQCFPDSKAREIFLPLKHPYEKALNNKYLFRIEDIQKIEDTQNAPIKESGFFKKQLVLGDISKIKFKGKLVPSNHISIKDSKLKYKINPIELEFQFTKDLKKIKVAKSLVGNVDNIKYYLSSGVFSNSSLNYIPRNADIFQGDIKSNFLMAFPNKQTTDADKEKLDG
jgi:hypothetical protein